MRAGLRETIAWYEAHRDWWEPAKVPVEAAYAKHGQ